MKVKSDHCSKFSNLSSWKEEAWKKIRASTGFEPMTCAILVEALIFFRLLLSNCLSWKIYCDDHSSLSSTTAVQIWSISYIFHIISLLTGKYELNELTSLPMCGFIAQLVEHRTGIAEVTGSNPIEALIFFQASSFQLLKLENLLQWSLFTFMIVICACAWNRIISQSSCYSTIFPLHHLLLISNEIQISLLAVEMKSSYLLEKK